MSGDLQSSQCGNKPVFSVVKDGAGEWAVCEEFYIEIPWDTDNVFHDDGCNGTDLFFDDAPLKIKFRKFSDGTITVAKLWQPTFWSDYEESWERFGLSYPGPQLFAGSTPGHPYWIDDKPGFHIDATFIPFKNLYDCYKTTDDYKKLLKDNQREVVDLFFRDSIKDMKFDTFEISIPWDFDVFTEDEGCNGTDLFSTTPEVKLAFSITHRGEVFARAKIEENGNSHYGMERFFSGSAGNSIVDFKEDHFHRSDKSDESVSLAELLKCIPDTEIKKLNEKHREAFLRFRDSIPFCECTCKSSNI